VDLVSTLLCCGNSFVLGHVSQIKGLLVAPLKHMLLDSDRVRREIWEPYMHFVQIVTLLMQSASKSCLTPP
jgi:hypothetical protein